MLTFIEKANEGKMFDVFNNKDNNFIIKYNFFTDDGYDYLLSLITNQDDQDDQDDSIYLTIIFKNCTSLEEFLNEHVKQIFNSDDYEDFITEINSINNSIFTFRINFDKNVNIEKLCIKNLCIKSIYRVYIVVDHDTIFINIYYEDNILIDDNIYELHNLFIINTSLNTKTNSAFFPHTDFVEKCKVLTILSPGENYRDKWLPYQTKKFTDLLQHIVKQKESIKLENSPEDNYEILQNIFSLISDEI